MAHNESDRTAVLTLLRGSPSSHEARTADTIATELGLPIERIEIALNSLEADGQVKRVRFGMWSPI
jgi:predicted Rossmann fold nucleotide-binding protein DprA/Smf involved in DNA uptake